MKKLFLTAIVTVVLSSCIKDNYTKPKPVTCDEENLKSLYDEKITLKSGVKIAKRGDDYIYLGDILLSKKQLQNLDEKGSLFPEEQLTEDNKPDYVTNGKPINPIYGVNNLPSKVHTYAVGRSPYQGMFWSMLRYTFNSNLNYYQKEAILDAISYMEKVTNVRFYNATGEPTVHPTYGFEYPYVEFTYSDVNESYVGRIGGRQELRLHSFYRGTIVHEICHALGMFHEQSRADRDDYVTIHYNNIKPKKIDNFRKETRNYYLLGGLDFESVMMYGSSYFALDSSKPTMTKKDGSTFYAQRIGLSEMDRKFLNKFYLPYKVREDVCVELDDVVYDADNNPLSEEKRTQLEHQLNMNRCDYPLPGDENGDEDDFTFPGL